MLTSAAIKARALELGFDLCGIAPAASHPELGFFREWLDRGYAGEMGYLARSADKRADVRAVLPSARTVIVTATVYNTDRPYSTECADPGARTSRATRGATTTTTSSSGRLDALLAWMRDASPEPFDARAYVDTGPVQERVYAQYAGIGWIGKNTCVINPERGSWIFLSEIICSLPLEIDEPAFDQCGTCTLCIEACPTRAIVAPGVLDSTRCISYLTIELEGEHPGDARAGDRQSRLRLRRLSGSVPVERGARRVGRSGLAAACRVGRREPSGAVRPIRRRAARGDAGKRDAAHEGRRAPAEPGRGPPRGTRVTR